jgi:hypothetical protein
VRTADYVINLVLSGVLLVGGYQVYFWCQRNTLFEVREFSTRIDERIPYRPGWVWVYMLLYYPGIASLSFAPRSPHEFTQVAASFMLLLALQVAFFLVAPGPHAIPVAGVIAPRNALRALPCLRPTGRCAVEHLSQHARLGRDAGGAASLRLDTASRCSPFPC